MNTDRSISPDDELDIDMMEYQQSIPRSASSASPLLCFFQPDEEGEDARLMANDFGNEEEDDDEDEGEVIHLQADEPQVLLEEIPLYGASEEQKEAPCPSTSSGAHLRTDAQQIEHEHEDFLIDINEKKQNSAKSGVALSFPGGGIRGAAFCHGILQYLIEKNVEVKAMCCASGGGFTASAFVQNVYYYMKNRGMSYKEATRAFFASKRMSKYSGFLINCNTWYTGIFEALILMATLLAWFLLFILDKAPLWFVTAIIVDDMAGDYLREKSWHSIQFMLISLSAAIVFMWLVWIVLKCVAVALSNKHSNTQTKNSMARRQSIDPQTRSTATGINRVMNLVVVYFVSLMLILMLLLLIKIEQNVYTPDSDPDEHSGNIISKQIGQFTFLSLFLLLLLLRPIFDLVFPKGTVGVVSLFIYVSFMSIVCKFRIYKPQYVENTDDSTESSGHNSMLFFILGEYGSYTDIKFNILLIVASLILLLPIQPIQRSFFHYYYQWRLQKSFFINTGWGGCAGIIPYFKCGGHVTLLRDLKEYSAKIPSYIALTVLNGWKRDGTSSNSYHLVSISSGDGKMKIVGNDDDNDIAVDVADHVQLSTSVAISGGAFAYRMGNINNQAFRFWQVTFGFGLGNWLYTRKPSEIRHALIVASQGMLTVCSFLIVFWSYTPKILLIPFFIYFVIVTCSLLIPPEHKVFGFFIFPSLSKSPNSELEYIWRESITTTSIPQ